VLNNGSGVQGSEVKGAPKTLSQSEPRTVNTEPVNAYQKQKPFSLEAERAFVFAVGKVQSGLLDIVFLDAIAKNEACRH
jgi:hypothetical protein